MHPAYSVIVFTTASGAGYGLLALLAGFALTGVVPPERWLGITGFGLALALVTVGLLASTFHLGRPERAWRAFSQWRTSWLSREGVVAAFTYVPVAAFAGGWIVVGAVDGLWAAAGWLSVLCAIATVYCTGMIYASLPTIRQWNIGIVPAIYLLLALATGGLLLNFLLALFGRPSALSGSIALAGALCALAAKLAYWRRIDAAPRGHTCAEATGLGRFGTVRPLEPAHSRPNFVMREMGYQVARKHALRLRGLTILLGFALPAATTAAMLAATPAYLPALAGIAVISAAIGLLVERWLFFAEAQHVVTLYYGAREA